MKVPRAKSERTNFDKKYKSTRLSADAKKYVTPSSELPIISGSGEDIAFQKSIVQRQIEMKREGLPHLYHPELKFYRWAREFFDSRNRMNFLCAANQIGKSSTLIRKNIEWACNRRLWKELWPRKEPRVFWYFLPSFDLIENEVLRKWIPDYMPRGDMKNHEWYGWDLIYGNGHPHSIQFRSGVTIVFKTYSIREINLQSVSVDMISFDEEVPAELVDECMSRLISNDGYLNAVMTPTQCLEIWYKTLECIGTREEMFPKAFKKIVSMYECQEYEDGSVGAWPFARIKDREQMCTSEGERLKRVMGRFVKSEGKRYHAFDVAKNMCDATAIPDDWLIYAAVDVGCGGEGRSATAICFIAVSSDYTRGRVFKTFRGENQETTAGDALKIYIDLCKGLRVQQACYDHSSKEFAILASRNGVPFVPANKKMEFGTELANSLLKSCALMVDRAQFDNDKLVTELSTVPADKTNSRKWRDDLSDAFKYCVAMIPWDFAKIGVGSVFEEKKETSVQEEEIWSDAQIKAWEIKQRKGIVEDTSNSPWKDYYDFIEAVASEYE